MKEDQIMEITMEEILTMEEVVMENLILSR